MPDCKFHIELLPFLLYRFGTTGSGKTFTISGEDSDRQLRGILPRCGEYLFKQIQHLSRESNHQSFHCKYKVRVSYLEIWNEHINDLLNLESTNLPVRWSNQEGFFVENLYVIQCEDIEDYMVILNEGVSNRRVASHDLNVDSSRSHSIFTVYIDIEYTDDSEMVVAKKGKIQIVDLAGSERLKESNSSGGTAVETGHINKSLLTLGKVINVLSDPRKTGDNSYVPYRDSKLTMLLMDSIGGSSKTVMIACVTPSVLYTEETYNTLLYAKRVKNIKNKPIINIDPHEAYVLELKGQIKSLQEELAHMRTSVASSSETQYNTWRNHEERTEAPPSYIESIQNDRVPPLTITRTQDEGLRLPPIGKKTYYPELSSPLPREIDVQTDRRKARMYGKMGETYCHDSLEREPFPVLKHSTHSTHTDPQYMDFLTVKMRMEEEIQNLRNTVHIHKSKGYNSDDSRFSSARSSRSHVSYPGSESNGEVKHEEQMKKELLMLRNENLTLRRLCHEQGIAIPSDLTLIVDSDVKPVSQPAEKCNDHQQQSDIASARKKPERPRPRKQPELQPFGGINQLGRMTSGGEETNLEKHIAPQSLRQPQSLRHEREPARDTIEDRKRSPSSAGSSRSQRSHSAASSLQVETKAVETPADLIPMQEDSATMGKEEPQDSENGLKSEEEEHCSSKELVTPLDTNSRTEEPSRPPPPPDSEVMEL